MRTYNFLAINPYKHGDETDKKFQVKLPDDMKLCMNYTYPNSKQQFWIFFHPYNEWLCEYINTLTSNKGYGLNHTHAYRIGDYMVGCLSNVHFEGAYDLLPTETLDELNERFLAVFGNHLIKIEEENFAMRMVKNELKEFMFFTTDDGENFDMNQWPEEKKQRYADVMARYNKEEKNPYHTMCIKRFIGFAKDVELTINTATIWGMDPTLRESDAHCMITFDNDKWFMLMDTYNPSVDRRLTVSDDVELWNELRDMQNKVNNLFEVKQ